MKHSKWFGFLVFALALLLLSGANAQMDSAAAVVFTASLSGDNVVPAVSTDASGTAVAVLKGNLLVVGGTYEGLSSDIAVEIRGGFHIHQGAAGENGGIVFEVGNDGGTAGTFSGAFVLTDEQMTALKDGLFYLQLHTANNKPGELRGQLSMQ